MTRAASTPWLVTIALALVASGLLTATDQWPQFRGPLAGVAADDPALADPWSETDNVVWKTAVPGVGRQGKDHDLIGRDDCHVLLPVPHPVGDQVGVAAGLELRDPEAEPNDARMSPGGAVGSRC